MRIPRRWSIAGGSIEKIDSPGRKKKGKGVNPVVGDQFLQQHLRPPTIYSSSEFNRDLNVEVKRPADKTKPRSANASVCSSNDGSKSVNIPGFPREGYKPSQKTPKKSNLSKDTSLTNLFQSSFESSSSDHSPGSKRISSSLSINEFSTARGEMSQKASDLISQQKQQGAIGTHMSKRKTGRRSSDDQSVSAQSLHSTELLKRRKAKGRLSQSAHSGEQNGQDNSDMQSVSSRSLGSSGVRRIPSKQQTRASRSNSKNGDCDRVSGACSVASTRRRRRPSMTSKKPSGGGRPMFDRSKREQSTKIPTVAEKPSQGSGFGERCGEEWPSPFDDSPWEGVNPKESPPEKNPMRKVKRRSSNGSVCSVKEKTNVVLEDPTRLVQRRMSNGSVRGTANNALEEMCSTVQKEANDSTTASKSDPGDGCSTTQDERSGRARTRSESVQPTGGRRRGSSRQRSFSGTRQRRPSMGGASVSSSSLTESKPSKMKAPRDISYEDLSVQNTTAEDAAKREARKPRPRSLTRTRSGSSIAQRRSSRNLGERNTAAQREGRGARRTARKPSHDDLSSIQHDGNSVTSNKNNSAGSSAQKGGDAGKQHRAAGPKKPASSKEQESHKKKKGSRRALPRTKSERSTSSCSGDLGRHATAGTRGKDKPKRGKDDAEIPKESLSSMSGFGTDSSKAVKKKKKKKPPPMAPPPQFAPSVEASAEAPHLLTRENSQRTSSINSIMNTVLPENSAMRPSCNKEDSFTRTLPTSKSSSSFSGLKRLFRISSLGGTGGPEPDVETVGISSLFRRGGSGSSTAGDVGVRKQMDDTVSVNSLFWRSAGVPHKSSKATDDKSVSAASTAVSTVSIPAYMIKNKSDRGSSLKPHIFTSANDGEIFSATTLSKVPQRRSSIQ